MNANMEIVREFTTAEGLPNIMSAWNAVMC